MGLDMYLTGKKYFWSGEHDKDEKYKTITALYPEMFDNRLTYVSFELGYWRKANAIHGWFVDNVQSGEDDCGTYNVTREQLQALKESCEEVLKHNGKANELLPTTSGFFFGSNEYDEWYYKQLVETIRIVEKCLNLSDEWDFEYFSSW